MLQMLKATYLNNGDLDKRIFMRVEEFNMLSVRGSRAAAWSAARAATDGDWGGGTNLISSCSFEVVHDDLTDLQSGVLPAKYRIQFNYISSTTM